MKGLILSLAALALYKLLAILLSQALRPRRHIGVFAGTFVAVAPVYCVAYAMTAPDLGFLPESIVAEPGWLDFAWGFLLFALNVHSVADFFFAVNTGFSTSILVQIQRSGSAGASTDQIVAAFGGESEDKILAWRLPRLAELGLVTWKPTDGTCRLTPKGESAARVGIAFKRLFNLGQGG